MNISPVSSISYSNYQPSQPEKPEKEKANPLTPKDVSGKPLTDEDKKQVDELKRTDTRVRAHEQAHMAAGGGIVRGGPQFSYEKGPDGRSYAVAGEVSIDTSKEKTPEQTITKMQRVKAAALAPSDPSAQDRSVASQAEATAAQARSELLKQQRGGAKTQGTGALIDLVA